MWTRVPRCAFERKDIDTEKKRVRMLVTFYCLATQKENNQLLPQCSKSTCTESQTRQFVFSDSYIIMNHPVFTTPLSRPSLPGCVCVRVHAQFHFFLSWPHVVQFLSNGFCWLHITHFHVGRAFRFAGGASGGAWPSIAGSIVGAAIGVAAPPGGRWLHNNPSIAATLRPRSSSCRRISSSCPSEATSSSPLAGSPPDSRVCAPCARRVFCFASWRVVRTVRRKKNAGKSAGWTVHKMPENRQEMTKSSNTPYKYKRLLTTATRDTNGIKSRNNHRNHRFIIG